MFGDLKKKAASMFFKKEGIVDKPYTPFDVRIGSNLVVSTNRASIYGAICTVPDETVVTGIGVFNMSYATGYQIYLGTNSVHPSSTPNTHTVQVITNKDNEIEQCRLYTVHAIVYPTTGTEWAEWLEQGSGFIGRDVHTMYNKEYLRDQSWTDSTEEWVHPLKYKETVYRDKYTGPEPRKGASGYTRHHAAMAYGKWLHEENGIAEYIVLSSQDIVDLQTQKSMSLVLVYAGIDLDVNEINCTF